nr:tripartite tricarboxylate transporter permease [Synergistales bacterium]
LGNVVCAIINIPLAGILVRVLAVPPRILYPLIVGLAFVGVYTINFSTVDLTLLMIFGVVGYLMKKFKIPTAPLILAVVIGQSMEQSYRMSMMLSDGQLGIFFRSGICNTLLVLAILSIIWPFYSDWRKKKKAATIKK